MHQKHYKDHQDVTKDRGTILRFKNIETYAKLVCAVKPHLYLGRIALFMTFPS
jgi:hypothetical protein